VIIEPPVRTRQDAGEAVEAIADAHVVVFGIDPSPELLGVLAAQSSFETDEWRAMWNWNYGNIRGAWSGHATSFRAGEIIDGVEKILDPGPENLFRSYPGAKQGAEDFIRFLGTASHPDRPNRYQGAWDAACRGSVVGFIDGLRDGGYFTAVPHVYLRGVQSHLLKLQPYLEARKLT
jgi:flagellum-specific peptidoglycan hydrolase FlgJ